MSWELYLPPERKNYNTVTGRFCKGATPHNKGREWKEWMSKRGQKRAAKGWENVQKYRPKHRPDTSKKFSKPVIAISDDGRWCVFPSGTAAAQWVGVTNNRAVSRCCQCNQARHVNKKTGAVNTDHRYMGIRFYYESDSQWTEKIQR